MDIEYERHNDSDIFFVKSRLGHFFHMHRHSQSELIYVKKGALNCVVGAEKYCVSKGCLMIIPKKHIHEYLESDDTEYSILLVSLPHIEQYTLSSAVITRDTDIINLFISMTQEAENRYEYYTDAVKHMAGYLTVLVYRNHKELFTSDKAHHDILQQALDYIDLNINQKLSIKHLSAHFGYSPKYFSKLFKECAGTNFKEYLNYSRIDHAKTLLLASSAKISQISEQCGFSNTNDFNRNFKSYAGVTPSQFRKSKSAKEE